MNGGGSAQKDLKHFNAIWMRKSMSNFELKFHSYDNNGDKDTFKDLVIYEDDLKVLYEKPYLILEYSNTKIRIRKDAIKILYKAFIE